MQELIQMQAKYAFEPEKWAYDILGFEPDAWQAQALRDYIDNKFCAWSTGSGVGKSALLAVIVLHFLSTRPFPKIPCTAPSQHQLFDVLWAEINKWRRKSDILTKMFKWTQTKVSLVGHEEEWFAVARTSRAQPGQQTVEGLQGFHAEHILFVVDECSGCPDQIMGAVQGALSTEGAYAILASNPTRRTGFFYRVITDPNLQNIWSVRFVNAETAKHVDKIYIKNIAETYGRDSDYYRMRVLGLPPRNESTTLISPEQVYEAHNRKFPKDLNNENGSHTVISCDPARFGDDETVVFVRRNNTFIERHVMSGMDTFAISHFLARIFNDYDADEVRVDEIGIGAGVVDSLKGMLGNKKSRVRGVHVGEKALDEQQFFNLRAEIFWNLRNKIGEVSIPLVTPFLDEELTTIRYGWDSKDKKIKLESKDEIRRSLGRSPNDGDSFAINCADLRKSSGFISKRYFTAGVSDAAHTLTTKPNANLHGKGNVLRFPVGIQRYKTLDRKNWFS